MKSMLKSLMSVAVAALAFTSCSTDTTEDVMPNGGSKTLQVNATIDQTRTVMADDHVKLNWSTDDQIYLYIGKDGARNEIYPKTGGTIKADYTDGGMVYANYSEGNSYSTGAENAEIYIVATQTQQKANEFAGKYLPMVAKGEINGNQVDLVFQPVGCVLVFNVYGPATNENITSIKITTDVDCCGYKMCDLTAETLDYVPTGNKGTSATVKLNTPVAIQASKPADTKIGENQVYLVVAPFNYAAATITVTTNAGSYTFETKNGIDCSQSTARVVNLNLAKATTGFSPKISVPNSVPEQSSEPKENLLIEGIVFKNISTDQISAAEVGVYSNEALTEQKNVSWLTVNNTAELAKNGSLYCNLAANESTESRTAYIGIQCKEANGTVVAQVAIPVTQVGAGSTPTVNAVATYTPSAETEKGASLDNGAVTLAFAQGTNTNNDPFYSTTGPALRCYAGNTITVSGSRISKIEIVRSTAKSNSGSLSADVGTLSAEQNKTYIWTGEKDKVVLTVSDHYHIASMTITYVESNEPKIIVPTVADKQPAEGSTLKIQNIVFKNIEVANVETGVYSDADLTKQDITWLTISNPAETLADGVLNCVVAANTGAERTAYIGIKGGGVQAAIAVTQRAQGAVDKYFVKVTSNLEDWTGDYLIVYEAGKKAFNGALTSGFNSENSSDVKITEGRILLDDDTNKLVVKILQKEGATGEYMYMLQTASGYYLYSKKKETNMNGTNDYNTAAQYPHSINIVDNSAKIMSSADGNRFWRFNSPYFRYYATGQQPVQLYKLQK